MTLPEIRDAYIKKCVELQLPRPGRKHPPEPVMAFYQNALSQIDSLIDQGPLPTGQEWNLEGRELPTTTWGVKNAEKGKE